MRSGAGRLGIAAWLVVLGCAPTTPRTQVTVRVSAEPGVRAASSQLHIRVEGGLDDGFERVANDQNVPLPTAGTAVAIALTPLGNDAGRVYRVTATAVDTDGNEVAQARVISGYVARRTLEYRLVLTDSCLHRICSDTQTCRASDRCVDATVDTMMLSEPGTDGGVEDVGAPRDSGRDAGPRDTGFRDVGSDVGPDDVGPEDVGRPDIGIDGGPFVASGTYSVTPAPAMDCAFGMVQFDGMTFTFDDRGNRDSGLSGLEVSSPGLNCVMSGASLPARFGPLMSESVPFDVSCAIPGDCPETYQLVGMFTDNWTWQGTFTATFTGAMCLDCSSRTFTSLTGTR